jgi:hypothetical protein
MGAKLEWKKWLKYYLIFNVAMVPVIIVLAATGVLRTEAGPEAVEDQAPIAVSPVFFGADFMPNFVGASLRDSIELLDEEFGHDFDSVLNIDSNEILETVYFNDNALRDVESIFVCTQNVAPGADPQNYVFEYHLDITVSTSCAGKVADFHMGPSALALGLRSPPAFNGNCDAELKRCRETLEVEGFFVRFLDDDSLYSYKTAVIRTGLGEVEAELAWIEPTTEWCGYDAPQNGDLMAGAMGARDQLLQPGQLIRLVRTPDLWDGLWFFHRLTPQGVLQDGEVPELSVNEQVVATGFWIPEANAVQHSYEDYYQPIADRKWTVRDRYLQESDVLLFAYAERLTNASNVAFDSPNEFLSSCITDQQEELGSRPSYANSDDDDDDSSRLYVNDSDGSGSDWDSGGSGSDWDSGGGGTNCTWVNGYTRRDGTRVSGHQRCG